MQIFKNNLINIEILTDQSGLIAIAEHNDVDIVMAAIVGAAGLLPTLAAVKAGKRVLLANKESLVMSGDIMMQASIEYRFPIYNFIYGGLFADAGNIWLSNENPDFTGGGFEFGSLFNQLALDTGFGLRFDFSFFIFRLDWGLRTKNPALENQWFSADDFRLRNAVWNFGIGYPF